MIAALKIIFAVIGIIILLIIFIAAVTYFFYKLFPPSLYEEEQNEIERERIQFGAENKYGY